MNIKKFLWLAVVLFFVATLTGCNTVGGGLSGSFNGFQQDLRQLSGNKEDVVSEEERNQKLHEKVKEEKLTELHKLLLTPGVEASVAVANAKDVAATTGSSLAWEKLVNVYFLGNKDRVLEWLRKVPELGFALAVAQSSQFSADEQLGAVKKTCNKILWGEYMGRNFPPSRTVKSVEKKCPDLKK